MTALLQLISGLHQGRKQYATAATMALLGVGVLTGRVDPAQVTAELKPVTFENVDEQAPAAPMGTSNDLIGLLLLLLGADSAANRAAIAKGTASAKAPAAGGE